MLIQCINIVYQQCTFRHIQSHADHNETITEFMQTDDQIYNVHSGLTHSITDHDMTIIEFMQ